MKKIIISIVVLLVTFQVQSQWSFKTKKGNGKLISKTRNVSDYDQILITGSFDVSLVKGKEGRLDIKIEENLLEFLITEVEGDKLIIKWKKGVSISTRKGVHIVVPFTEIDKVGVTGSGDVVGADSIKSTQFETFLSGSGKITLNLDVDSVTSKITGSGETQLLGSARNLNVLVTGSGDFNSYQLSANDVNAKVTGSGDIHILVSNKLTAKVTGSGDISYKGNPKYQNFKVTGSGDIESH